MSKLIQKITGPSSDAKDVDSSSPELGLYQRATHSATILTQALPVELKHPKVAIVCGSGLGGLAETIDAEPRAEMAYGDIAGFPVSTVQGHAGKLVFGLMGASKLPVVLLVGRAQSVNLHDQFDLQHYPELMMCHNVAVFYEGHTMSLVTYATRVCKLLGVETMIVTNAAGGLNPDYSVGDIVILNDHLNLAGLVGINPLIGPNENEFGVRFPPLSDAYDLELRRAAYRAWSKLGITGNARKIHEGVYAFVAGPSYETRAECRMLRLLGADVVGMSTVPEIVVARHSGIRVLAFSLVTNKSVLEAGVRGDDEAIQKMSPTELEEFLSQGRANHEEVLEAGRMAAVVMQDLVKTILGDVLWSNFVVWVQ